MKILFLIDRLGCGGKERQFSELVSGLVACKRVRACDLAVVSMGQRDHFDKVIESAGVEIIRLCRGWRWDPWIVVRLSALLRHLQPAVVVSFNEMATFYAALARKPPGTRLVDASLRNALPLLSLKERALGWVNFRSADLVVANSRAGLVAKGVPPAKARVLHNGFDFKRAENRCPRDAVRTAHHIHTTHAVGMVATFSRFKDWDTFFEAASRVWARRQDVTFVAVGGGQFLEAYRRRGGGHPGVVFTGRLRDVESLVGTLDTGVLCSNPRFAQEGIPNVVMEYMALGLPAVVTSGGGVSELVLADETGFIVEPRRPEVVADKVCWLLDNPEAAKAMGERGRQRIKEEFSMKRAADCLMALIEEAAGVG